MPKKKYEWRTIEHFGDGRKVSLCTSLSEEQYVYHYLEWDKAKLIFLNSHLRLGLVSGWRDGDPYEKAWCKALFERNNQLNGVSAYGICCTNSRYNEPFWRMIGFGKNSPIVRLRFRVKDILKAGIDFARESEGTLYLGEVQYLPQEKLNQLIQTLPDRSKDVSSTASRLLLMKRRAFKFESEVRLLWLNRKPQAHAHFIGIEATKMINQVMITPHVNHSVYMAMKEQLLSFGANEVKQSALLKSPRR